MKKFTLIISILFCFMFNTYAGSKEGIDKITYSFIIGEVGEVTVKVLDKNPYYSLESGGDKRKYYTFDLENYKYITENGDETKLSKKGVHIYENEFDLDFLSGEYTKGLGYRPQKGDYIISIYNISRDNSFDNIDIYNYYLDNNIIKPDYINTNISRVINCDNFSDDFLSYLGESVGVPYSFYKSDEEKVNIQRNIIKDVVNKSGICNSLDNLSQSITNNKTKELNNKTKELNNKTEKSKNIYLLYFLGVVALGLIFYVIKKFKKN